MTVHAVNRIGDPKALRTTDQLSPTHLERFHAQLAAWRAGCLATTATAEWKHLHTDLGPFLAAWAAARAQQRALERP